MTLKIELSDAVITEAWDKFGIADDMRAAITAALEAMVACGMAFEGVDLIDGGPMLYIRLDGGKK